MAPRFDPGEILLASFPFTDHSAQKVRPVLVVGEPDRAHGEDVVVVPISSRMRANDPYGFAVHDSDAFFRQSGLRMSSTVRWSKLMTISNRVIMRRLGSLPRPVLDEIRRSICVLLGAPHEPELFN